jgi:hypothetical protein
MPKLKHFEHTIGWMGGQKLAQRRKYDRRRDAGFTPDCACYQHIRCKMSRARTRCACQCHVGPWPRPKKPKPTPRPRPMGPPKPSSVRATQFYWRRKALGDSAQCARRQHRLCKLASCECRCHIRDSEDMQLLVKRGNVEFHNGAQDGVWVWQYDTILQRGWQIVGVVTEPYTTEIELWHDFIRIGELAAPITSVFRLADGRSNGS